MLDRTRALCGEPSADLRAGESEGDETFPGELSAMAGDVNLFIQPEDDDEDDEDEGGDDENAGSSPEGRDQGRRSRGLSAEVEIMIAERSCHRRGFAREAVLLMMHYGLTECGLQSFTAKIGLGNTGSRSLFEEKLAFQKESVSEIFQEITLRFWPDPTVFPSVRPLAASVSGVLAGDKETVSRRWHEVSEAIMAAGDAAERRAYRRGPSAKPQ